MAFKKFEIIDKKRLDDGTETFKAAIPIPKEDPWSEYIGRWVKTKEGPVVKIEHIAPNFTKPTRIDINGQYQCVMLDFFAQMNHEQVSQEDIDAFDQIEHEVVTPNPKETQWKQPLANPSLKPRFKLN